MQCLRVDLMQQNWVVKGYDQSVTCLADDPRNLAIRSSKRRNLDTLSQQKNKQANNEYLSNAQVKLK